MIRAICINKIRDNRGNIKSYVLKDTKGVCVEMTSADLKRNIAVNSIDVLNLQIDKAGRLVDKAMPKLDTLVKKTPAPVKEVKTPVSETKVPEKSYIDRVKERHDIIQKFLSKDSRAAEVIAYGEKSDALRIEDSFGVERDPIPEEVIKFRKILLSDLEQMALHGRVYLDYKVGDKNNIEEILKLSELPKRLKDLCKVIQFSYIQLRDLIESVGNDKIAFLTIEDENNNYLNNWLGHNSILTSDCELVKQFVEMKMNDVNRCIKNTMELDKKLGIEINKKGPRFVPVPCGNNLGVSLYNKYTSNKNKSITIGSEEGDLECLISYTKIFSGGTEFRGDIKIDAQGYPEVFPIDTSLIYRRALVVVNKLVRKIVDHVLANNDISGFRYDYNNFDVSLPEDVEVILQKIPNDEARNAVREDLFMKAADCPRIAFLLWGIEDGCDGSVGNIILTANYESAKKFIDDKITEEAWNMSVATEEILENFTSYFAGANIMGRAFILRYDAEQHGHDIEYYKREMLLEAIEKRNDPFYRTYGIKDTLYRTLFYCEVNSFAEYYIALKCNICLRQRDYEVNMSNYKTDYCGNILANEAEDLLITYGLLF